MKLHPNSAQNLGQHSQTQKQIVSVLIRKLGDTLRATPTELMDHHAQKVAYCFVACHMISEMVNDGPQQVADDVIVALVIKCDAFLDFLAGETAVRLSFLQA